MPTSISTQLESLNLISGPAVKRIFDQKYKDVLKVDIETCSDFMKEMWSRYLAGRTKSSLMGMSLRGFLQCSSTD